MAIRGLTELEAFAAVASARSFRAAATKRGVSASALSQTVRHLEAHLGARLLSRTTRSVSLTEAGERLLQGLVPALQDIAAAVDAVNDIRGKPAGTVRVNAPMPAIEFCLAPLARPFLDAHPDVSLELISDSARIDIVQGGYDAGVRFGEDLALDMVAIPLGRPLRYLVAGSDAYYARFGRPENPRDLLRHRCIRHRFPNGSIFPWEFEQGGQRVEITPNGPLTVNDPRLTLQAGLDGIGLIRLAEEYIGPELRSGRLTAVLEDWCPTQSGWFLYYPSRRQMPSAFRAFVDFVLARVLPPTTVGPGQD